ncbi:uncharacterized protein N7477_001761 [Penicillium maclennaniae]|uniref:uncharacterized protein n=1 Tax=Penicillium maclennaniae TaxID=1343394 RepID=UPI00253F8FB1|nr:uncharacterized protein N7477_001761 [Penicillium maclennaniae]KAJ5681821.1 hypothetical protein N7477_001761 [Penicillium maclennaniae]
MGNIPSIAGHDCLLAAVGHDSSMVTFRTDFSFKSHIPLYNLNTPVIPVALTYPTTTHQVADIISCAVDNGYKVQARSGGHSYANYGLGGTDGAVVVDLKHFQQFSLDPDTFVATIGAGTLLGDLQSRLDHAGGRAVAHGTCPQVGTGGHFTIGGLDHVIEAEVVLANSTIIRASKTHNQDVFFAIKGAAACFGIVTEFKLRTHEAPHEAVQYSFVWNLGNTSEKAKLFKDWQRLIISKDLSRKFASELVISAAGVIVSGTYFGSKAEWDAFELEKHFPPSNSANIVTLTDWMGMLGSSAENLIESIVGGIPVSFYAKSMSFTPENLIPDSGVDAMFRYIDATNKDTLVWFIIFDLEGGATNDVPTNATAYAHRDAIFWMQSYAVNLLGIVSPTTKDFLNGLNAVVASYHPGADFGAYPGYVDPQLIDPQSSYWGPNLPRLQTIKAEIDPHDVFHNPQSVQALS